MRKKVILTATALLFCAPVFASQRVEDIDRDGDGFKEARNFYQGDKLVRTEVDKDKNGKPDVWSWVVNGVSVRTWYDTNGDGKPDKFYTDLKGRQLMLKEFDHNGDGKVDERREEAWDPNKAISSPRANGTMGRIPNPGYVIVWRERDTNFDGIIDEYGERGNAKAAGKKVGKPIDPLAAKQSPQEKEAVKGAPPQKEVDPKGPLTKMIEEKNQKYDYNK
jgi:hypothetical protein